MVEVYMIDVGNVKLIVILHEIKKTYEIRITKILHTPFISMLENYFIPLLRILK